MPVSLTLKLYLHIYIYISLGGSTVKPPQSFPMYGDLTMYGDICLYIDISGLFFHTKESFIVILITSLGSIIV